MKHLISERSLRYHGHLAIGVLAPSVIFSLLSTTALAQTVWQNQGAGSWFDDTNWSALQPSSGTDATVANGGTAQLATGATGYARNLTVQVPSSVQITAGSTLQISGSVGDGVIGLSNGTLRSGVAAGEVATIANPLQIGPGGGTIDSNGANGLLLTGNISSAQTTGPLVFTGTNGDPNHNFDIVLYGTNSFAGGAIIRNGTQVVSTTDNGIGAGSLQVDAVGVFAMGASDQAVTTLSGGGNIYANGFLGNGTTTSTLKVQNGSFLGILGDGASAQFNNGAEVDYTGVLALDKVSDGTASGGTLTLTNANSYFSGGTKPESGTIAVANFDPLGTGAVTMSDGTAIQTVAAARLTNNITLTGTDKFNTSGSGPATPLTVAAWCSAESSPVRASW